MTERHPGSGLDVDARFVGFEAVLALRGEVDMNSADELGAYLDEAIDQGHRFVVLDLARLDFIDGSALRVIGSRAKRLMLSGGALSIRSPSAMVLRLLDIVSLADLVRLEQPEPTQAAPDLPAHSAGAGPLGLSRYLRRVSSVPSSDEVVNGALRLVVALSHATVGGADGVSVSLRRQGRLSTVAASDQTILDMDAGQYMTGEGPCIDASVEGSRFHAASLDSELRWPAFAPKARALGINAILSSPLLARNKPVGALNIYSRRSGAFDAADQELAAVFANETSTILSGAQADVTDNQLDSRLGEALRTRELISQAQGVIMERDGVGEGDAYTALRRLSLESGQPLRARARDIVATAGRHKFDATDLLREIDHG